MTNEDLLIRYCAWTDDIDNNIVLKIRELLRDNLSWDYIFNKAFTQGVAGLMYRTLSNTNSLKHFIPESIWERLEDNYYNVASRNMLLNNKLEDILIYFWKVGIEVIILKGFRLVEGIYANVGLRAMRDMDVLIRDKDLLKADTALRNLGYSARIDTKTLKNIISNPYLYLNAVMYNGKDSSTGDNVHLHWHLVNSSLPGYFYINNINMENIWKESRLINLGEKKIRAMSIHHELIYLCMHSFCHFYDRLILLCDIHEYIKRNKINWEKVILDAFEFNLQRPVYYGLYLTSKILDVAIPHFVFLRLKRLELKVWDYYFLDSVLENKQSLYLRAIAYLAMIKGLKEKIRLIYRSLFPSRMNLALIKMKETSKIGPLDYITYLKYKLAEINHLACYTINYILSQAKGKYVLRNYKGKIYTYLE